VLHEKDVIVERSVHDFRCTVREAVKLKNEGLTQKSVPSESAKSAKKSILQKSVAPSLRSKDE
jgi:hypothetical protein